MNLTTDLHSVMVVGADADLIEHLDNEFQRLAIEICGGKRITIPSLVSVASVKKMLPQARLDSQLTHVAPTFPGLVEEMCLSPAACLPVYPMMREIAPTDNCCLTSRVKVFRYEGGCREPGTRLWEFNVREIVFVGTPQYVASSLDAAAEWTLKFAQRTLGHVRMATSSDAFTGDSEVSQVLERLQKANKLKREALWIGPHSVVPIASINNHLSHFSRIFGWSDEGRRTSGCVGFGLERWLHAVRHQATALRAISG
jgi:hypothetical protein